MTRELQPGDWISGPFWDGAMKVVTWEAHPDYDVVTVTSDGSDVGGATRTYVLTPDDRAELTRTTPADFTGCTFDGHPEHFRLGMQAHRLRLAHAIDPYAGSTPAASIPCLLGMRVDLEERASRWAAAPPHVEAREETKEESEQLELWMNEKR